MGDRANCTLSVFGDAAKVSDAAMIRLAAMIVEFGGESTDLDVVPYESGTQAHVSFVTATIRSAECNEFVFEEVNYGEMPSDVSSALEAAGLSFAWEHASGGGFDSATTMYDADTGTSATFGMLDWDIAVPVQELTFASMGVALRWYEWFHAARLYNSQIDADKKKGKRRCLKARNA